MPLSLHAFIMARLLTVALLIVLISSIVQADSIDICVRCAEPSHAVGQYANSTDENCLTLNELLMTFNDGNNALNFTQSTTVNVRFLPGLHFLNSANKFRIGGVQLVILTGEGATLRCLSESEFGFKSADIFTHVKLKVSGVTIDSCYLEVVDVCGTFLTCREVTFIDSYVRVLNSYVNGGTRTDAIIMDRCGSRFEIINSSFLNSSLSDEVGFFSERNSVSVVIENVVFKDFNSRLHWHTHALYLHSVHSINLTDTTFQNICGSSSLVSASIAFKVILKNVTFVKNRCTGYLLSLEEVTVVRFDGNCNFINNTNSNGVILREVNDIQIFKRSKVVFRNNHHDGMVLYADGGNNKNSRLQVKYGSLIFEDNTAGEAIMQTDKVAVQLTHGRLVFERNKSMRSQLTRPGAILLLQWSAVSIFANSSALFRDNTAELSGGMTLVNSTMDIETVHHVVFESNEGGDGGGMAFYERSSIRRPLDDDTVNTYLNLYFSNNRARRNGGAIFVKDSDYVVRRGTVVTSLEFIVSFYANHVSWQMFTRKKTKVNLHFVNNTAKMSGSDLYGGWIDIIGQAKYGIKDAIQISSTYPQTDRHAIASDPTRICMCSNSIPVCNITEHHIKVFPGQTFEIEAVAVGQRMGLVPSSVLAQFNQSNDDEGSLGEGQSVQSVSDKCSNLYFAVFSEKKEKSVQLTIPNTDAQYLFVLRQYLNKAYHIILEQFSITVELKDCPLGFLFNITSKTCSCLSSIVHHTGVQCDHKTFTVHRSKYKWIAATFDHVKSQNHGVLIHNQCPRDYCRTDDDSLSVSLESPDSQCAFRRSGDLCGSCQEKLSQVFGTSRCKKCSNITLLGVIPGVLLAGLVLIVFIGVLNITVTVGTINGLIFYANVIQAGKSIFFRHDNGSSFSSIFIAWLNLDLGIEACFYDGLDAYAKTWLQFVFPIYLWLLLIAIIVSSHYSVRVSKFIPNNALQVLATIFLLSYAKIIRNVIIVFSSTVLTYPDGYEKRVWFYDGNVEFLTGKHIPLFIATLLLLILLSIPYTLSLVSIQCLQRVSHFKLLLWVHKLMPLFDAYTGPYKHKHRYWTGLLLLVRVVVLVLRQYLVIFTLNRSAINLLTIAVMSFTLLTYTSYMGVYKNRLVHFAEIASLANLGLLSVTTFYQLLVDSRPALTTNLSVGVAFVTFIAIVLYHGAQRLLSQRKVRHVSSMAISYMAARVPGVKKGRRDDIEACTLATQQEELTHTSVELHEPLINKE